MIKHAKPKNLVYYLKRLAAVIVAVWLVFQLVGAVKNYKTIDVESILNKSELKNKTLTAKVQKIEQGALIAYFMEEHSNPIVSISFIFKNAGSAHDMENKQGLAPENTTARILRIRRKKTALSWGFRFQLMIFPAAWLFLKKIWRQRKNCCRLLYMLRVWMKTP